MHENSLLVFYKPPSFLNWILFHAPSCTMGGPKPKLFFPVTLVRGLSVEVHFRQAYRRPVSSCSYLHKAEKSFPRQSCRHFVHLNRIARRENAKRNPYVTLILDHLNSFSRASMNISGVILFLSYSLYTMLVIRIVIENKFSK